MYSAWICRIRLGICLALFRALRESERDCISGGYFLLATRNKILVKTDSQGKEEWSRTFEGSGEIWGIQFRRPATERARSA